jgi:hypothetical protein
MATDTSSSIAQIGELAGEVWHILDQKGPMSIAKLVKEADAPRDMVMQALGWLAREDKLNIEGDAKTRLISLHQE